MGLNDTITSLIRTWVPIAAGWIITHLASLGVEADAESWEKVLMPVVMAAYYAIARTLEKVNPVFGWLLGAAKAPQYTGS